MSLFSEPTLSAQRCLLQEQLRAQREEIVEQFFTPSEARVQFPRSVTMRFLSGRFGLKILSGLVVRKLVMRYPKVLANAFTLLRLFNTK